MKKITIFTFIFLSLYSHSCKALQQALLGLELNKSYFVSSEGERDPSSVLASDDQGDESGASSLSSSIHSFVAVDEDPDWEKIPKSEDQKREKKKSKQIFNLSPINKQTKAVTQSSEKKDPLPTDSFPHFLHALVDVEGVKKDFKEVGYFLFEAAQHLLGGLAEED